MKETILARAPSSVLPSDATTKQTLDRKKVQKRISQMFEYRENFVKRWKEIRDHQLPYLGEFDDTQDLINPARRRDLNIYNDVAWEANQIFAAGVMSGLTPPSRQWFRFSFSNKQLSEHSEAATIIDERMEITIDVLAKSNFYNAIHNVYMEFAFGQCPLGTFPSEKGVTFIQFPIGTYAIDVGADGRVNTFARKYQMTAIQLREQFGEANLPKNVLDVIKNDSAVYSTMFNVYWLVEPNPNVAEKEGRQYMPFRSIYWVDGSQDDEWLYIGGCKEFPVPVARYQVNGLQPYGKGAGWYVEGDSKVLGLYEKDSAALAELIIKPPMQSSEDVLQKGVNLIPGGLTITNGQGVVSPLFQVRAEAITVIQNKIEKIERSIKRSYNSDLFLMLDQLDKGQMTAEEVIKRTQEKLQQLGPVVERLQYEFLSPIIERVYNILDRAQIFPPIPPDLEKVLEGGEVKIEYISPLAQAQKMSGLVNIEQAVAFIAQLAQMYPEVKAKLDPLKTVDSYFEKLGAPATIKKTNEEVEMMIKQQQEAEQKQAQMQQAALIAQSAAPAAQAARNLTEAARDGNPALQEWLGMGVGNV